MEIPSESLLAQWPGVFFRQRPDLTFASASPHLADLTGLPLERWLQEPGLFWSVVHESDTEDVRQRLARVAEVPAGFRSTLRLRHAVTGRVAYLAEFRRPLFGAEGRLEGYEGFWLDQTRQTLAERRLDTAAWKETLALLTMGLAHDFNNVLGGILGLSETFLSQITPDHPFHDGLSLMKRNAREAAQLIQRIAQLHQVRTGSRTYHDLNAVVREAADLIKKILPRSIEFSTQLAPEPLPIYADGAELQQVILNLALNASDAMPDRGKLQLVTSLHTELAPREYSVGARPRLPALSLAVTDTGRGIPPRHLGSIFEPFFSTKPMNRGSGLGLYNARIFAEKHDGALSVESTEGAGTTLRLWLPQADFTEAEVAQEISSRRRRSLLVTGSHGDALERTAQFLRQHHYHVITAGNDAEEFLRSPDYSFDGVLALLEPRDTRFLQLSQFVRKQKLPLKLIVQAVGCEPDELDPKLIARADLVLPSGPSEETLFKKLHETLA